MFGQQQTSVRGNAHVCSFYLKGQCKYGTQCWNLHPPNQGAAVGGIANSFGVGGNVFGAKTSPPGDSKEFTEFVKQVSVEMTQWERSGQWLLSSFTPIKSHPLLAGFSDLSPEELRSKAYDALKTNTSSAYQEYWSKRQQQYKQLRDALKVPTPDAYQAMKEVFHAKSASEQPLQPTLQAGKTSSHFGKPSVFGGNTSQPQPSAGLLGAKPQTSLFGGGGGGVVTPTFGGNQSSSANIFGDTAKKSLFGESVTIGSQNTTSFGTQPSSSFVSGGSNLFKSNTPNTLDSGSVFGGPPKLQGNSLFGGGTTTCTATPVAGNIFGFDNASSTSTTGNAFGSGTSTNVTTLAAGSIFGGNSAANVTAPATGGVFGGSTSAVTITPDAGGVFGGSQNQTSGIFGSSGQTQGATFSGMASGNNSNAFLGSNTTGIFGNKTSIFAVQQNQAEQQQNTTTLFGNPPSSTSAIFEAKPLTNDSQLQNTASSVFGSSAASGSTFGSALNPSGGNGLFGNAPEAGMQSSSIYGSIPESASRGLFGKQTEAQQISPSNVNTQTGSTLTIGANKVPSNLKAEWFTPLDELEPADKGQFESDVFTSIPLYPPPIELCF